MNQNRICLIASSSGGHVFPCLEVGRFLENKNYDIVYIGIKNEMEEKVFPIDKSHFLNIPKSFQKSLNINECLKLYKEKKQIKKIFNDCYFIIGFGGFITAFCTFFVKRKHCFFVYEQNAVLGDSIRFSGLKANLIFTSFKLTKYNQIYHKKIYYLGSPRLKIINNNEGNKIGIIFGSLGSEKLLRNIIEEIVLKDLNNSYKIVLGKNVKTLFNKLINKSNIEIIPFANVYEDFVDCRLIITRGGATTLMELLGLNKNLIIIPSPNVKNNHQYYNAKYFADNYLGSLVEEKDNYIDKIKELINKYTDDLVFSYKERINQKKFQDDKALQKLYALIKLYENKK